MQKNAPHLVKVHQRLSTDLKYYAAKVIKITDKSGKLVPFKLNKAQLYIHDKLEQQKQEKGRVRAIILKGRQQGASTYITLRYYHNAAWNKYRNVYILSHESKSTQTLFKKVMMYYEESPAPLRPTVVTQNRNEFEFKNGSRYSVGTAGARATGRSQTNQLFHGSEVAFYENSDDVETGVLQTVADVDDTEIILESTANGLGNSFYTACMNALEGKGEYILIFVPWYWQEEYEKTPPENWRFTEEELEIKQRFNLTDAQLYWRYNKILELKSENKFKQEYPFTVKEAFQSSGESLIKAEAVQRARKNHITDKESPRILGVDPARGAGRDGETTLVYRQGRHWYKTKRYPEMDEMRLAGIIAHEIDSGNIDKCFIDVASGYGTVDRLHELGYRDVVTGVHFGQRPFESQFGNKRSEMAAAVRDWLNEGGVSIPDDEETEMELLSIPDFIPNSRGQLVLEPKEKIIDKIGKSTDIFDSIMLTFAYPVRRQSSQMRFKKLKVNKESSPLSTMAKKRLRQQQAENQDYFNPWANQQKTRF